MPTGIPTRQKKCPICGNEFVPEKPSQRYCKKDHYQPCPVCGKPVLWNSMREVPVCSKECRRKRTRRRNLEKYGVEHPMSLKSVQDKHKSSMKAHYGVEHALQSKELRERAVQTNRKKFGTDWALGSSEVHDRIKKTMTDRYGAPTTLQSRVLRERVRSTNLERYGFDNAIKSNEVQKRKKKTTISIYGVDNPMKNAEVKKKMSNTRKKRFREIDEILRRTFMENYGVSSCRQSPIVTAKIRKAMRENCGVDTLMHYPEIRKQANLMYMERYEVPWFAAADKFKNSAPNHVNYDHVCTYSINRIFAKKLTDAGFKVNLEKKIENEVLYDIEVVGQNTLIEIDPSYTHNIEGLNHLDRKVDPSYHLEKTQIAESHGYRCIHVFDWDNWDKIVQLITPKKVKIGARKCSIVKIVDQKIANKFMRGNHINGQVRGSILTLGLEYDRELVMCMSFGRSRYNGNYTYELLRMCSKKGMEIVGGASKLFRFATNQLELDSIISYCDAAKFTGDVYRRIGMSFSYHTAPNVVWSKGNKYVTSNLLRQRGYDKLFNTNYGKGTDNEILMLVNGWVPVCDCGQYVFSYTA